MREKHVFFQGPSVITSRHIESAALTHSRGLYHFLTINRPEINTGAVLLTSIELTHRRGNELFTSQIQSFAETTLA
jgi:hypothetical protein